MSAPLELALGPVLFNWPAQKWFDFYARVADEAPVERVYLGEVVCSKRQPFREQTLSLVAERLARAGKEVVYSTLALPTTRGEIEAIGAMIAAGRTLEANDIATVHLLEGRPHAVGPFLNIYNEEALALHLKLGATRVCLPPELPLAQIALLARGNSAVEVFAFGRVPLALSARCYHARARGLGKVACQFVCEADPDGLGVTTLDGQPFLAVNGIQTMGYSVVAAVRQARELAKAGVAALRLSPQSCDMIRVARLFRDLLDGHIAEQEAIEILEALPLPGPLSDGFLRGLAGVRLLHERGE
jgi:collagenase-like PrtC family protease